MAPLVMIATLLVLVLNILAATGRINAVFPNEISDRYPTVTTPAGWAFSIWGLIYIGLLAFSVYQLLPSRSYVFDRIRVPYIASCILNCAWIFFWHHFYVGICAFVLVCLLASLFWINAGLERPASFLEAIVTKGAFGLYAGWVTVALLLNLLVALVAADVQLNSSTWSLIGVLCLLFATIAAFLVRIALRNFVYPLAIAWATAGIGANQSGNTPVVVAAAFACVTCLIISGSIVTELKGSQL